jgi:hypothetical protein
MTNDDCLLTPPSIRQTITTMADMAHEDQHDGETTTNATRPRYLKLTPRQISQLIQACATPAQPPPNTSPQSIITTSTSNPAYFHNAKYEDICCKPIKPSYDGTETD